MTVQSLFLFGWHCNILTPAAAHAAGRKSHAASLACHCQMRASLCPFGSRPSRFCSCCPFAFRSLGACQFCLLSVFSWCTHSLVGDKVDGGVPSLQGKKGRYNMQDQVFVHAFLLACSLTIQGHVFSNYLQCWCRHRNKAWKCLHVGMPCSGSSRKECYYV